jgi:hypothetical protein
MKDPRLVAQTMTLQDPDCREDLWLQYWANGGKAGRFEFDAYLHILGEWDAFELEILVWAIEDLSRRIS